MSTMNRLASCHNQYQGKYKKVLCVCSAGLLRSPTAALVLGQPPFCYNTRAAGISEEYALVVVDDVLLEWADEVVCMQRDHAAAIEKMGYKRSIYCLDIKDDFEYRNGHLQTLIARKYELLAAAVRKLETTKASESPKRDSPPTGGYGANY